MLLHFTFGTLLLGEFQPFKFFSTQTYGAGQTHVGHCSISSFALSSSSDRLTSVVSSWHHLMCCKVVVVLCRN